MNSPIIERNIIIYFIAMPQFLLKRESRAFSEEASEMRFF